MMFDWINSSCFLETPKKWVLTSAGLKVYSNYHLSKKKRWDPFAEDLKRSNEKLNTVAPNKAIENEVAKHTPRLD